MKALMPWGSGLVAVLLFATTSHAYNWTSPVFHWGFPVAPDACGPGWYVVNGCGMVYGPNYYLVPPCMPFNGLLPGPNGQALMAAQRGIPPWAQQGPWGRMPNAPYTPNSPYPPQPPLPTNTPWPPNTPFPPNAVMPPGTPMPPRTPLPPTPPEQSADHHAHPGIYPSHPYIRGPRDFFMWNEDLEDMRGRDIRPNLVAPQ
jgi:hypothetical protein